MTEISAPYGSLRTREDDEARLREIASVVGHDLLIRFGQEMCRARRAHQGFADDVSRAVNHVESEFLEWKSQAMLIQNPDGTINEAKRKRSEAEGLHLMATMSRFLNREYENAP